MTTDQLSDEQSAAVETFLADWVAEQRIPGAAIAIVDGDEPAYAEGFGARRLEDNTPATPDTLFGVGSCTKPITATAVVQLVERTDLALDDPVDDYLPHLADAPGEPVTVEELLGHTSGMPSDGMAGPLTTRPLGVGHVEIPLSSEADFRRHVQGAADRRVTDRETFQYYNSGYVVLGRIVEAVSGQPFAEYVDDHVLAPLGMTRSTFEREAFEADDDRMTPYLEQEGSSTAAAFPFDPLVQPAGGLVSSVRELADYVQLLMGDGTVDGETVVAPGSVEAMTTPVGTVGTHFDGREVGYGYGLSVQEFLDDRLVGHGGGIAVSSAWVGYLEDAGLGVALACTTGPETHPSMAGPAVLALLRGAEPADTVPHYRLVRALETAAGEYENYRSIRTPTVERVGGALKFEGGAGPGGGPELLLAPTRVEEELLLCTTTMASGLEREARFEFGDGDVDLFFENDRFEKSK